MDKALGAACRAELRDAGLTPESGLARLLALLRTAPETHLSLADVTRMAIKTRLATTSLKLAGQLEMLASHGLIERLPTTATEPVYDTIREPHAHLIYEETTETVDLQVSTETLIAILRKAMTDWPDDVDVFIRLRANRMKADDPARRPESGGTPVGGSTDLSG